jgi:type VI secretion system secreted protein Hcp
MRLSAKTTLISRSLSLFSLIVILAASPAAEAAWFMDIDGVPGQATEKNHKNWVVCEAVQFGVARAVSSPDGRTAPSAPGFSEVTLTRRMDVSSPDLFIRAANGNVAPEAVIELTNSVGTVCLRIVLKDVAVTGYTVSAASDKESIEEIKVTYSKITMTYFAIGADGKVSEQITRTWDVARNMEN